MDATPQQSSVAPARLPLVVGVGWGVGTLVSSILLYTTNTLFLRFMTDYLGIAAATAGFMIGASKIYDAILDPVFGVVTDRTRHRWGRRRPYLLLGTAMASVTLIIMFAVPDLQSPLVLHAYVMMALIILATSYTVFNVPYLAMPAEMTSSPDERSRIMSFRVYASSAAMILSGFVGPIVLAALGSDMAAYATMAWILSGFIVFGGLTCLVTTAPARFTRDEGGHGIPFLERMRAVAKNATFVQFMICKIVMLFALTSQAASVAYFVKYHMKAGDDVLGGVLLTHTIGMIASQVMWIRLSTRVGKVGGYRVAAWWFGLACLSWWPASLVAPAEGLYAISIVTGMGAGGCFLLLNALLPDIIVDAAAKTGHQHEGLFASVYTSIEKVGQALATASVGLLLGAFGYIQSTKGVVVAQPESAYWGIGLSYSIVPGVLFIASARLLRKFPLR
jgi:GPH family glycoside/pentoside/hexuronide:cation symporter